MYKLSNKAVDDFSSIYKYSFLNFGEHQADSYPEDLEQTLTKLSASPFMGQDGSDLTVSIRHYNFQQHAIYYRIKSNYLFITRILHQQMDMRSHLS